MSKRWDKLGNVELVVLLALMRLNDDGVRRTLVSMWQGLPVALEESA